MHHRLPRNRAIVTGSETHIDGRLRVVIHQRDILAMFGA